jgi:hypothetical protein
MFKQGRTSRTSIRLLCYRSEEAKRWSVVTENRFVPDYESVLIPLKKINLTGKIYLYDLVQHFQDAGIDAENNALPMIDLQTQEPYRFHYVTDAEVIFKLNSL